jgi:shikimate dehydrogenase
LTFDQIGEYSYVVDLVYRSGSTQLLAAARAHGARTLDGLEILVAQGALSFELWTGRKAPLQVMRRAAREEAPAAG